MSKAQEALKVLKEEKKWDKHDAVAQVNKGLIGSLAPKSMLTMDYLISLRHQLYKWLEAVDNAIRKWED